MTVYEASQAFQKLFQGSKKSYVEHNYNIQKAKTGGKVKSSAYYKKEPVTDALFLQHLRGAKGLGLSPIDDDDKCFYGVIDIDIYRRTLKPLVKAIYSSGLPLVPVRSKSGGVHLYLMMKKRIAAKTMIAFLREIVELLGMEKTYSDKVEVFPKQASILESNGSCITLPYFGGKDTVQYIINSKIQAVPFSECVRYFEANRVNSEEIREAIDGVAYADAPPCIQTILLSGALEADSGRDNFLFSTAVYLKKKFGEDFRDELEKANSCLGEPLSAGDVDRIFLSVKDKEYNYKCKDIPCKGFCNSRKCAKREFGVGREKGHFTGIEYGQIYRMLSEDSYYIWELKTSGSDTEFKKVHFEDEAKLMDQRFFAQMCLRYLNVAPVRVQDNSWFEVINTSMSTVKELAVSATTDTSASADIRNAFTKFLVQKRAYQSFPVQVKLGLTFLEDDKYYFTHEGFEKYLGMEKVKIQGMPLREQLLKFGAVEDVLSYDNKTGSRVNIPCWSKDVDKDLREADGYYKDVYEYDDDVIEEAFEKELQRRDEGDSNDIDNEEF